MVTEISVSLFLVWMLDTSLIVESHLNSQHDYAMYISWRGDVKLDVIQKCIISFSCFVHTYEYRYIFV